MENYPKLNKGDFLMFSRVLHNGIARCHVRCGAATAEPKNIHANSMENCLSTILPLKPNSDVWNLRARIFRVPGRFLPRQHGNGHENLILLSFQKILSVNQTFRLNPTFQKKTNNLTQNFWILHQKKKFIGKNGSSKIEKLFPEIFGRAKGAAPLQAPQGVLGTVYSWVRFFAYNRIKKQEGNFLLEKYCGVFKFAVESKSERVHLITIDCLMVKLFGFGWLGGF
jgi:hypothetical protein